MNSKMIISGLLGVMGLANLVYSIFINPSTSTTIFGFDVSRTIYLAFWSIITILMFKDFFRHLNNKNRKS